MPEKNVTDIPRSLREQYEKGKSALQRENYDYAIAIFNGVLQNEPAFYDCREALRATQFKKIGSSTSFFRKMIGSASSSPLLAKGQLALRNNPKEAINIAEQILNSDPSNAAGHRLLADAALASDLPRTAVLSLEILFKNAPRDKELAMKLGGALAQAGQVPRAERLYGDLMKVYPGDMDLAQAYKNLSARRTLNEGGYDSLADGTGSYRDILRDKAQAVSLEQENRQVKAEDVAERLIAEYEERLRADPGTTKHMRTLAELYTQKKDYDTALGYYHKIASIAGADSSLERAIADLTVRKYDHQLASLSLTASDYAERAAEVRAVRDEFQIKECQSRAEKYPNDLQIRFELGQLFFQADKIGEAIQEFQKAQHNPHRRIQALNYLGQCFSRRGMYDLAARTLQNAIKEKPGLDEEKKDLIYSLGSVLEKMGKKDEAIEQFKLIYENDIGYRDVAAKVDAYYSAR